MKILVTGTDGQLGFDVVKILDGMGVENIPTTIKEFDLTNFRQTEDFIKNSKPSVVIHCAAYTAVDKAEENIDDCMKINQGGAEAVAEACAAIDAKMIYISTDYVFNGEGERPWETYEQADPINTYGLSKYKGELAVKDKLEKYFIVRTSWVFGINGSNFVKTMLRLSEKSNELKVVDDQTGSPTYTADLAQLLCQMAFTDKYGTYHASNEGFCSWAEFAEKIFELTNKKVKIVKVNSSDFPTKASRPQNSRLSKISLDNAGFKRLPIWQDALKRYLSELKLI